MGFFSRLFGDKEDTPTGTPASDPLLRKYGVTEEFVQMLRQESFAFRPTSGQQGSMNYLEMYESMKQLVANYGKPTGALLAGENYRSWKPSVTETINTLPKGIRMQAKGMLQAMEELLRE